MSDQCCQNKACELEQLREKSKVLWTVLAINAVMFVVELGGWHSGCLLSLTGDSLDMLS